MQKKKSLAFKVNSLFLDIIHIDGIVYNVHYRKNFFDHECVYQFWKHANCRTSIMLFQQPSCKIAHNDFRKNPKILE